jgi:hypothetical protein
MKDEEEVTKLVAEACAWATKSKTTFELDLLLQAYVGGHLKLLFSDKKAILKSIAEIEGAEDLPDNEESS